MLLQSPSLSPETGRHRRAVVNKNSTCFQKAPEKFIEKAIKSFVSQSQENCLSLIDNTPIFDEPLVAFARGDDPLFLQYKETIGHFHLTPREALEESLDGTCGVCIERCPAAAITPEGHDKNICWSYQETILSPFQQKYKATDIGCGLCQTSVPCEGKIPGSSSKAK